MNKIKTVLEILKLPKVKITIYNDDNYKDVYDLYKYFNKPHKKYKIFKNKTLGVMLLNIPKTAEEYEKMITGKNSVGYFSRRCQKLGYHTEFFNQKDKLDEIYAINTSSTNRQGRKMSDKYLEFPSEEEIKDNVKYLGVFNNDGLLVAYTRVTVTREFCIINKILGHSEYQNDNIMYLLLRDMVLYLIDHYKSILPEKDVYFMYDTFFGASEGLKLYKTRNKFVPYRVKWKYVGATDEEHLK